MAASNPGFFPIRQRGDGVIVMAPMLVILLPDPSVGSLRACLNECHGMNVTEAYGVLDVSPQATAAEVEAAYKAAVQAWHPDRFSQNSSMRPLAEAKLKRVLEAYAVLTKPPEVVPESPPSSDYIDSQALYQGFDPRLRMLGRHEIAGRPAEVRLMDFALVTLTARRDQSLRVLEYPYESVLRVSQGSTNWVAAGAIDNGGHRQQVSDQYCLLDVMLPEAVQHRTILSFSFRSDELAQRFARNLIRRIESAQEHAVNRRPSPPPEPVRRSQRSSRSGVFSRPPVSTPPTSRAHAIPPPESLAPLGNPRELRLPAHPGLSILLRMACFVVLALVAIYTVAGLPTAGPISPSVATAEHDDFNVWTEPTAPLPNSPYEICIRLKLPKEMEAASVFDAAEDLRVLVLVDGHEELYPAPQTVDVVDGVAIIRVPVARSAPERELTESIEVHSRCLHRPVYLTVAKPKRGEKPPAPPKAEAGPLEGPQVAVPPQPRQNSAVPDWEPEWQIDTHRIANLRPPAASKSASSPIAIRLASLLWKV